MDEQVSQRQKHPHLQRVWTTPWIADAYLVTLAQALFYAL
jgi:hypothetical protein